SGCPARRDGGPARSSTPSGPGLRRALAPPRAGGAPPSRQPGRPAWPRSTDRPGARARPGGAGVPPFYLSQPRRAGLTPAMSAAAGIVRIHAQTIRPAMPQRTAERRVVAPTPTMALAIVSVVPLSPPHHGVIAPRTRAPPLHADRDHRQHD